MIPDLRLNIFGASRMRLVRQAETAECGLACLAMIAAKYGAEQDLITLRKRLRPSVRGADLKTLMDQADAMGFSCRAVRVGSEGLAQLQLPAILHWDLSHYVVIERVSVRRGGRWGRGRALIHDPNGSSGWVGLDELASRFSGIAVELWPTDIFERREMPQRLRLGQLWRRVRGAKRALAQTLVLSLVMQAFVLASPYYMQLAIDTALPSLDLNLLTVLAIGFALFAFFNATASLLRSFVLLSAGTTLSFSVTTNLARRLFRLPISWFEKRHVGDILSRFQSVGPIQEALTVGAVSAFIDGALTILTLVAMFYYSVALTAIALCAFALYVALRLFSFSLQRDAQQAKIVTSAREQSALIESVRGIVTLRLYNCEASRHAYWQSRLVDAANANVGFSKVGIWQSTGNTSIFAIERILSLWVAVSAVIAGGFSVGMIFAFFAYKEQFLSRAGSLVDQFASFRMLNLHLERLSDIALSDEDPGFLNDVPPPTRFSGAIELRDISFRYSPGDPLVLAGANLVIAPGEHVGIMGPSGCGKSTLLKIMLGLLEPESGEVLVDGVPLRRFGYQNYRQHVGGVLQDDSLFSGSIGDNIALFDREPDRARIIKSAAAALIDSDISEMPMGYETLVGDMGSTLSGGQKQRVLLARALYREPAILIMDEGTSHVDPGREAQINRNIAAMGTTRVIVAHRAETLKLADRVLSLQNGRLVDLRTETSPSPVQA